MCACVRASGLRIAGPLHLACVVGGGCGVAAGWLGAAHRRGGGVIVHQLRDAGCNQRDDAGGKQPGVGPLRDRIWLVIDDVYALVQRLR